MYAGLYLIVLIGAIYVIHNEDFICYGLEEWAFVWWIINRCTENDNMTLYDFRLGLHRTNCNKINFYSFLLNFGWWWCGLFLLHRLCVKMKVNWLKDLYCWFSSSRTINTCRLGLYFVPRYYIISIHCEYGLYDQPLLMCQNALVCHLQFLTINRIWKHRLWGKKRFWTLNKKGKTLTFDSQTTEGWHSWWNISFPTNNINSIYTCVRYPMLFN